MKTFENTAEFKDIKIQLNKLGFNVSCVEKETVIIVELTTNPAYKGIDAKELKSSILSHLNPFLPKSKKIKIDFVDLKVA